MRTTTCPICKARVWSMWRHLVYEHRWVKPGTWTKPTREKK